MPVGGLFAGHRPTAPAGAGWGEAVGGRHRPTVPPRGVEVKIIRWSRAEIAGRVARVTIDYRTSEPVDGTELTALMEDAWPDHALMDPEVLRKHSAGWVCAYDGEKLVGFVNVAWDGGTHFFLLDTTVAPSHQRRGIGAALVAAAVELSEQRGGDWLHVDYEQKLSSFYEGCGFRPTPAGLYQLYDD
jgi:ribosomal protein S18 acetylase RimI-like enzyme